MIKQTTVRSLEVCDCADPHAAHEAFIFERAGEPVRHYPQEIVWMTERLDSSVGRAAV